MFRVTIHQKTAQPNKNLGIVKTGSFQGVAYMQLLQNSTELNAKKNDEENKLPIL